MGMEENPDSNHCGEEQTSTHILAKCPGPAGPRTAILGKPIISIADIKYYNIKHNSQICKTNWLLETIATKLTSLFEPRAWALAWARLSPGCTTNKENNPSE